MNKDYIYENYKLFNIAEVKGENKNICNEYCNYSYNKCSVLEEKDIHYSNSTKGLEI